MIAALPFTFHGESARSRGIADVCEWRWFIGDWSGVSRTNDQFIPSNALLHGNSLTDVSLTEGLGNTSLGLVPPGLFYTF